MIEPDSVHDLHTADGLPEEQGHHTHVQTHMSLASNQIALLHQR